MHIKITKNHHGGEIFQYPAIISTQWFFHYKPVVISIYEKDWFFVCDRLFPQFLDEVSKAIGFGVIVFEARMNKQDHAVTIFALSLIKSFTQPEKIGGISFIKFFIGRRTISFEIVVGSDHVNGGK